MKRKYLCLCKFTNGSKGEKKGKRQVSKKAAKWGPPGLGARPAGPQLARHWAIRIG